jgi:putative transposase
MPNHIHAIVVIMDHLMHRADANDAESRMAGVGDTSVAATTVSGETRRPTLGAIVGAFKAAVTRTARERDVPLPDQLWQRNFFEHVIRSEHALEQIRKYTVENPASGLSTATIQRRGDDDTSARQPHCHL